MLVSAVRIIQHMGPWAFAVACYYEAKTLLFRHIVGKRFIRKNIQGSWMDLDVNDRGISRTLLLFGRRELDHRIILQKVLREGMTILDIGANIGYYVLMERRIIGSTGLIVAVEPGPNTVQILQQNVALNGYDNIKVIQAGLSDTRSRRTFFVSQLSNLSSYHRDENVHASGEEVETETRTVPDVMAEFGAPDLIRMDVEGHEVEIFNGMLPSIEKGEMAPMIIFEPHIRTYGPDHDFERPLRRLFAAGYHARYVASSSDSGTAIIDALGYHGSAPIGTDFKHRVIYENIGDDHLVQLLCETGGLRSILLAKKNTV